MAWNTKYADLMDQQYWTLDYLGLKGIDQEACRRDGDYICVPLDQVRHGSTLYRRIRSATEQADRLRKLEEPLNHVLDIALAIAPDALINHIIARPLGMDLQGPVESVGREIGTRYPFARKRQLFQQDGFFVGDNAIIGLEIKTGARSSPVQIAKYALAIAMEEAHSGARAQVGLLYILPAVDARHWAACGITDPLTGPWDDTAIAEAALPLLEGLPRSVQQGFETVLARLSIAAIAWSDLYESLDEFQQELAPASPGDQTLWRLIEGLKDEISLHDRTGVSPR